MKRKNWLSALEICVSGHIFRVLGGSKREKINISTGPTNLRQDWDTRKTFPFFQIAIGWDEWIEVHFALIGITVSYSSMINEELGASRYCLFVSFALQTLLGKTISGPECLEKGPRQLFLFVACAEANCSGGSCTTVAPVSSRKTNGTKEVVWRATPATNFFATI